MSMIRNCEVMLRIEYHKITVMLTIITKKITTAITRTTTTNVKSVYLDYYLY